MKLGLRSLFKFLASGQWAAAFSRAGIDAPAQAPARRPFILLVLAACLAALFIAVGVFYALRPATLRIAVGPGGSDDVRVVQTIAQVLARERGNVRLRTVVTNGATESAAALDAGTADLAVVRGDLALPKSARAVATLRKNVATLWTLPRPVAKGANAKKGRAAPAIRTVGDLAGRRVGIIGRTSANLALLSVILNQYGVAPDRVEIMQFGVTEATEAARSDRIDALLSVGPLNSRITADAVAASSRNGVPRFLEIDAADTIAQRNPKYEAVEIPAGSFGAAPARPQETIKTIGFNHHIAARDSLSETVIAAFTRQLFSIRQAVVSELPHAANLETPDTEKDAVIPVHPGAAAYVDGEERTFLDRYSDFIWWTLMALSAVGSVGAWLASYLRRDERHHNVDLRERLLDMLSEARQAETLAQLDLLQAEADQILRSTLQAFDHGAIDDSGLAAADIVLQQFHSAVADRRSQIAATPMRGPRPAVAQLTPVSAQN